MVKEQPHITAHPPIELDYLVIGHITRDLVNGGFTIGGTASYAAHTTRMLGHRAGIITSASPDLDLNQQFTDIPIFHIPAAATTTFENIYTTNGRRQMIHAAAKPLSPDLMPQDWHAAIVHLGPVAQECDPALVNAFGDAFVGLTPQGWMRCWDEDGQVHSCRWENAAPLLTRADAVVLSEEDIERDAALIAEYAAQTAVLVVTQGAAGCTVYAGEQRRQIASPTVVEVNATGAGDIFAAAFFIWLNHSGDPWQAAHFANCIAAQSVKRVGLNSIPTSQEVTNCKKDTPSR